MGCASIASQVIPAINKSKNGIVTAIASRSKKKADEWGRNYKIPNAFGSYDQLLNFKEVDAIYIPLPNSLHAEWSIKALEAGHNVLCEKPIASNQKEALAIAEASKRTGKIAVEAFMYRHHPQYSLLFDLLKSEKIGDIRFIHSQFTFMLDDKTSVAASKELSGGALMDVGCYCVNFSRMISGEEPIDIKSVQKRGGVDEVLAGMMKFPSGIIATFETGIDAFEIRHAEIVGTKGSIILHEPWIPGDEKATLTLKLDGKPAKEYVVPAANSYQLEVEAFGENPKWPISDAIANMHVIDELLK